LEITQLESDKVKESYNTQVCTVDDLIQNYGKKAEKDLFCLECADFKECKGINWLNCPHRTYYITEEVPNRGNDLKKKWHFSKEEINIIIKLRKDGKTHKEIGEAVERAEQSITMKLRDLRKKGVYKVYKEVYQVYDWGKLDPKIIQLRKQGVMLRDISSLLGIGDGVLGKRIRKLKDMEVLKGDGRSDKRFYKNNRKY